MSEVYERSLAMRVWTLFKSWRLTFEQVDEMLCLKRGTAERLVGKGKVA